MSTPTAVPSDEATTSRMTFSNAQMISIEVAERAVSVLSIVGSLSIIASFVLFPYFRKPINRLIFLASWGNLFTNVATLISISGITAGADSALCQFQAFTLQLFIPADSIWIFCMALNVYLTFFKSYEASSLRTLEKWYFLLCYGLPFVPAIIFLLLHVSGSADVYGPATLWCWVALEWDWMRIAFFYGPVWIIIAATMGIYLVTGKEIYRQRNALRAFSSSAPHDQSTMDEASPPINNDITRITEIQVTTETIRKPSDEEGAPATSPHESRSSFSSTRKLSPQPAEGGCKAAAIHNPVPQECTKLSKMQTTITAGTPSYPCPLEARRAKRKQRNNAASQANRAAWGYAKVSMLMFVAMVVVWAPSSINRLYALAEPDRPLFILNFLGGLVLPSQGFWNATIYVSTSWPQCKMAWYDIFGHRRRPSHSTTRVNETSHTSYGDETRDSEDSNKCMSYHSAIRMPSRGRVSRPQSEAFEMQQRDNRTSGRAREDSETPPVPVSPYTVEKN